MPPKNKDERLTNEGTFVEESCMQEAIFMKVLQRIIAVRIRSSLCSCTLMSGPIFSPYTVGLVDVLQPLIHALDTLRKQVNQVSAGKVDKTRLSNYNGLYKICLEELIAAEETLALLEELKIGTDEKKVASHDGKIRQGSNLMSPVQASPLPLDEAIRTIMWQLKRQEASLYLCRQVHSLIEEYSEMRFDSALNKASNDGHKELLKFLTETFMHGINPLKHVWSAPSFDSNEDIAQSSRALEVDLDSQKLDYGNALQEASFAGNEKLVRTLFHRKIDVNAQGGYYGNALQAASFAGHLKIAEFLINRKADVNIQGGYYGNALQAASFAGHQDMVQLLLDQQADVNAQGGHYGTSLQAASFAGHKDIVKCLYHNKADVNAKGGLYGNALQAASFAGHDKIVKFLFHKRANVNAQGGRYGNAVQAAAFAGHQTIVQILLSQGADVDVQGFYGLALEAASSHDHEKAVKLLRTFGPGNGISYGNCCALVIQIAVWLLGNEFFQSLLAKAFEEDVHIEIFRKKLVVLVERYGEDLVELTDQRKLKFAVKAFVSHRWQMIEAILSLCTSVKRSEGKREAKMTKSKITAFLEQRLVTMGDRSDESKLELSKDDLDEVTQYLASTTTSLHSFLGSVCRLVYSRPLEAVRAELLRGLEYRTGSHRARFELNWRIEEYLDEEIVKARSGKIDRRIVGSLLTLSGDIENCYANSCEAYMKWKWPSTYSILLEALALGLNGKALDTLSMMPGSVHFCSGDELARGDTINAFGSKEFLIEIAQQLSWLTASIRLPIDGQVSLSDSLLIIIDAEFEVPAYKVLSLPLHSAPATENSCWVPLFLGTVLARNFPIPEREQERGLELPFDLLATVAGNMVPKCHDGGIYLKGYSRLLYPVSGSIPGSVQWHLLTSASRRLSLPDDPICSLTWMKILDRRILSSVPRTFLGYCREVIIDLGTNKTADHYRQISFSGAKDASQGLWIQPPSSFTWGTSGMNIFGASFSHSIVYGKALAQTITGKNDDYLDVLDHALRTPIILYDDESHRGWMVTAFAIILHMIRTWSARHNCFQSSLPCLTSPLQVEDAAHSILAKQWNLVVRDSWDEDMCKNKIVKDLVMEFWCGIQKRYEEDLFARHQSATGVELTAPKLHGWDYMDLVMGRPSCKKQLDFDGNWIDLTREVTVFFGGGFGDVIQPAPGVSICAAWNPIPSQKMHLTATIDCIQKLSCVRGHLSNLTPAKLTNKSFWNHHTSTLFTDCTECRKLTSTKRERVKCPKALQTLDSSAQKSSHGSAIPAKGAIIFGKQPKTRPRWLRKNKFSMMPSRLKSQIDNLQSSESVTQSSVACKMVYVSENQDSTNESTGELDIQLLKKAQD